MANEQSASVDAALKASNEASERSRKEFAERTKGKPTPTQEENDRAALGENFSEHEDDGSGPDPNTRQVEAKPSGGGYQTRTAHPAQHARPGAQTSRRSGEE